MAPRQINRFVLARIQIKNRRHFASHCLLAMGARQNIAKRLEFRVSRRKC
jgi:hypothetical protein